MLEAEKTFVYNKKVVVWQPTQGYRFSIDTLMMVAGLPQNNAAFTLLELGSGVGTGCLAASFHFPQAKITGVETQELLHQIALQNKQENNFKNIEFLHGDMCEQLKECHNSYDVVMCNPPFYREPHRTPSADNCKGTSHFEGATPLEKWVRKASKCLRPYGELVMIHEAASLDRLIVHFKESNFGSINIIPLWPKEGREAKRIIIKAKKLGRAHLHLHHGITIHCNDGSYTSSVKDILEGKTLIDSLI